ncbi:MAG: hypothetical protein ACREUE_18435, partial [Panacagrimonas sp.]
MREGVAVRKWALVPVCLMTVACAIREPLRHEALRCEYTALNVVFISEPSAVQRANIEQSAGQLSALMSTPRFIEACAARPMNRTRGRSAAAVCRHLACAGPRDLKVGLYHDADMPTVAFEKRGAVFLNTARARAGRPSNLVHEFAHVLGYSHVTWWG